MIEWTVTTVIAGASELVTTFLKTTIYIIVGLTYVILQPIDAIILQNLPSLSNAFTAFADVLNLIGNSIGWAISCAGLSTATISLIVAYYAFKLTAPMFMYMIKLALAWYDKIRG
jgi:hypothetical protein